MFCPTCGANNAKLSKFCTACGGAILTMNDTAATASSPSTTALDTPDLVYAGFWLRAGALLIDTVATSIIFSPLSILSIWDTFSRFDWDHPETADPGFSGLQIGLVFLGLLFGWLYYSISESSTWQGTLGKRLLGLQVVDLNGHRIRFGRATARYCLKTTESFLCCIGLAGYVMAAFTEKNQALHDMVVGTLVVKRK